MKKQLLFLLGFILLFFGITWYSADFQRAVDGYDTIGFPWTFYKLAPGMCHDCPLPKAEWDIIFLIEDGVLWFLFYLIVYLVFQFIRIKLNPSKTT